MSYILASASSQYLSVGTPVDYTGDYTVTGFFKSNNTSTDRSSSVVTIEGNGAGIDPVDMFSVRADNSSGATLQTRIDATTATQEPNNTSSAYSLSTGKLYFFAMTRDGNDSKVRCWSVFRNYHFLEVSESVTDATDRYAADEMNFGLLARNPLYASIEIFGCNAWNRLLTESEIEEQRGNGTTAVSLTSIVGSWPMDADDPTADVSGQSNPLTANGSPTTGTLNADSFWATRRLNIGVNSNGPGVS